ncbi:MAG: hypothetical protein ACC682_13955 [Gemmatimonadota bacterium]
MDLSFHEKSLWLMFGSLVTVFAFYFGSVLPNDAADVMPQQVVMFVLAIIVLVIMQVAGHVVIAMVDRRTETDERDRLIELKGTRNAGYVLATGVFLSLSLALISEGNFVFTHVLLGFWVLAQLVEIGSQLILYRRGA